LGARENGRGELRIGEKRQEFGQHGNGDEPIVCSGEAMKGLGAWDDRENKVLDDEEKCEPPEPTDGEVTDEPSEAVSGPSDNRAAGRSARTLVRSPPSQPEAV